ncbi:MAG: hypothetical protein J0L92_17715 [Deltaproteobacteria bacterium]|nr:hypothetical protein [Deltaproteobacteria bacterium]
MASTSSPARLVLAWLAPLSTLVLAVPATSAAQEGDEDDVEITVTASTPADDAVSAPTTDAAASSSSADSESVTTAEVTVSESVTPSDADASATAPEPSPASDAAAPSESAATAGQAASSASSTASPSELEALVTSVLRGLRASAWVQVQYEHNETSEDTVLQGGILLNRDRFSLRRGRVRLEGRWDAFEIDLEIDVSTTRGIFVGPRRATVGLAYREHPDDVLAIARVRAGLTEIPFGHELRFSQRDLLFVERTQASLGFFRGPVDVGVRVDGALGPFRYDVAVLNGVPVDDRAGDAALDPVGAPDVVGRLGVESALSDDVTLAGGVSFLWGQGFHAGSDAQKPRLEWRDLNESGTLDTGEIIGVPGRAATPSYVFEHWAVGADVELSARTSIGRTDVFGEVVIAQNLDRSLFVADPIVLGQDVRQLALYGAATQEILGIGLVGFRYELYQPNLDLFEPRRGIAVPRDATIHTLSPLLGVRLPEGAIPGVNARLVVQYDVVRDSLARDVRGVPTDLANDQLTVRVQGEIR